jgi:hypothetical protein
MIRDRRPEKSSPKRRGLFSSIREMFAVPGYKTMFIVFAAMFVGNC